MWMQTATGKKFELDKPENWHAAFDTYDIAHALSNLCRFNGHSRRFYSVAEHVVLGTKALLKTSFSIEAAYRFLHHDDTEAYIGDVTRPLKKLLPDYVELERRLNLNLAIHHKLYRHYDIYAGTVKEIDSAMLWFEKDAVMANPPEDWGLVRMPRWLKDQKFNPRIWRVGRPAWYWRSEYLRLHEELSSLRDLGYRN